jgi:hypothetical protein
MKKVNSIEFTWAFVISFITYPVLFALDRANYDLLITLLLGLYLVLFLKKKYLLSALVLSLSTAIKPFSGLFYILFLFDKKYREVLIGFLNFIFLNLVSLIAFKGSFFDQVQKYIVEMLQVKKLISTGSILRFSSDLYDAIVVFSDSFSKKIGKPINLGNNSVFYNEYFAFALIVLILILIIIYRKKLAFWKKIAVISFLIILLPMSTGDYRLMYLYLPLWLFLAKEKVESIDTSMVILWGLLFIPKGFIVLNQDQNINMIVNPLLIIIMICILLSSKDDYLEDQRTTVKSSDD